MIKHLTIINCYKNLEVKSVFRVCVAQGAGLYSCCLQIEMGENTCEVFKIMCSSVKGALREYRVPEAVCCLPTPLRTVKQGRKL